MEVATIISITVAIISAIAAIFGMYMAFKNYNRFLNNDTREDSQAAGNLQSDVSYIKRRIDDVLLEQKEANKTIAEHSERIVEHSERLTRVEESTKEVHNLTERVTRVEESAKQAHKRIDGLEHRMDDDK